MTSQVKLKFLKYTKAVSFLHVPQPWERYYSLTKCPRRDNGHLSALQWACLYVARKKLISHINQRSRAPGDPQLEEWVLETAADILSHLDRALPTMGEGGTAKEGKIKCKKYLSVKGVGATSQPKSTNFVRGVKLGDKKARGANSPRNTALDAETVQTASQARACQR